MNIENRLNKPEYVKYVAKDDGTTLYDHTQHVLTEMESILNNIHIPLIKLKEFTNKDIDSVLNVLSISISYHDYGKKEKKWQESCKTRKIQQVELRHEIASLFNCDELYKYIKNKKKIDNYYHVIIPVIAHHGNLSRDKKDLVNNTVNYIKSERLDNTRNVFGYIKDLFNYVNKDDVYKKWYLQAFYRYYVQLADKRASARNSVDLYGNQNYVVDFKKFEYCEPNYVKNYGLRNLQRICKEKSNDDILILRSPTGQGKTLASIIWANEQIKNNNCDRVIIAMPTQFTSNSLALSVKDLVSKVSVQHSKSKFNSISYEEYKWSRLLQNPVTVCTIDHLLNAMTLSREEHQHILYNMTNSCVIIDEADFYDDFVQSNMIELLKFLRKFNVKILIMSATLPEKFVEIFNNELKTNLKITDDVSDNDRVRINITNIIHKKEVYEKKLQEITKKPNAIIYCNTVERSIITYQYLLKIGIKEDKIVLYHSSFKEKDKIQKEKRIMEMLGETAWKNGTASGYVIMTQIGELSINISSDYMLTDICPLDRMVQRFGRGCRFHFLVNKICNIDIVVPYKNGEIFPAPYGDIIDKEWIPNKYFQKTLECIKKGEYNYNKYLKLINDVYSEYSINLDSKENSDKLIEMFQDNFIFNSDKIDDDINNTAWKARNIDTQCKIFVEKIDDVFEKYSKFEHYKNMECVSIPIYKFDILNKNGLIEIIEVYISKNNDKNKASDRIKVFKIIDGIDVYDETYGFYMPDMKNNKLENFI